MRIYEFRGKRLDNGKWIYGSLGTINNLSWISEVKENRFVPCRVSQRTVGQFTGILDEDQHRIYEGDIIKIVEEYDDENVYTSIGVVCFVEGIYELQDKNGKHFAYLGWTMHNEDIIKLEVIGNIHDNPELLKGGEQ